MWADKNSFERERSLIEQSFPFARFFSLFQIYKYFDQHTEHPMSSQIILPTKKNKRYSFKNNVGVDNIKSSGMSNRRTGKSSDQRV